MSTAPARRPGQHAEDRARRRRHWARWQRLTARAALGAAVAEDGYLLGRDPDATARSLQSLWENRDQALATLAVGGAAYEWPTRAGREPMREWVIPLHQALAQPLGIAEQTDPCRYLHVPKNFWRKPSTSSPAGGRGEDELS